MKIKFFSFLIFSMFASNTYTANTSNMLAARVEAPNSKFSDAMMSMNGILKVAAVVQKMVNRDPACPADEIFTLAYYLPLALSYKYNTELNGYRTHLAESLRTGLGAVSLLWTLYSFTNKRNNSKASSDT